MQFIMIDKELIMNQELTNDEIMAYALLCDRMRSSRKNSNFYDDKESDSFVIYTQTEMAIALKVSPRKVNSIFKHLSEMGLVRAKKQFSRASRLFLPQFKDAQKVPSSSVVANSATTEMQNLQSNNHKHLNQNKNLSNTVNTATNEPSKLKIEIWKQAIIEKVGLTKETADEILLFTNRNLKHAYQIVRLIMNARNSVVKEQHLSKSPITNFESNANIKQRLAIKLKYIFNYLPKNLEEQGKYLTRCLKNFFLAAFGIKNDKLVQPQFKNMSGTINKKIPEWMKTPYDPEADKLSKKDKLEINELLDAFYKNA